MSQMQETAVPEWTLGWRLQRSLAHAGIGIEEMAAELGVSRSTISRWVNDHGEPRIGYLKLWALRTGVPLGWILDEGLMFDKRSPATGGWVTPCQHGYYNCPLCDRDDQLEAAA